MPTTTQPAVHAAGEGLRLPSGPGRDLIFKVSSEQLDFFICEVAPHGGPPLHVHHVQDELLYVLKGTFRVRIGDEEHHLEEGGFAQMPAGLAHAFLNLTDEPGELAITFTPGGGEHFFAELGPATRGEGPIDREAVAAIFERHGMSLLGPPLS
jgi:quercetin dioxygenase-like cupin family protein